MLASFRAAARVAGACLALLVATAGDARAFNFGEHHDIGVAAVRRLPRDDAARLLSMYGAMSHAPRMCPASELAYAVDRKHAACVSIADLGALAADHACTAAKLRDGIARDAWTLRVVERAMETRRDLQEHGAFGTTFTELWRRSDLDLDLIDAEYGARAASNDAHFALPRASDALSLYLYESLEIDRPPLNAVGLQALFHVAALRFSAEASRTTDAAARDALLEQAMLCEAFAVHFLEDMFASGHIVGTFGDVATRKGTHDLYCEIGVDARTWRGQSYGAHGDAHMTDEDRDHASAAVATSFAELLGAAAGAPRVVAAADAMPLDAALRVFAFDVCKETAMPAGVVPHAMWPMLEEVLADSPIPARSTTLLPPRSASFSASHPASAASRRRTRPRRWGRGWRPRSSRSSRASAST